MPMLAPLESPLMMIPLMILITFFTSALNQQLLSVLNPDSTCALVFTSNHRLSLTTMKKKKKMATRVQGANITPHTYVGPSVSLSIYPKSHHKITSC